MLLPSISALSPVTAMSAALWLIFSLGDHKMSLPDTVSDAPKGDEFSLSSGGRVHRSAWDERQRCLSFGNVERQSAVFSLHNFCFHFYTFLVVIVGNKEPIYTIVNNLLLLWESLAGVLGC